MTAQAIVDVTTDPEIAIGDVRVGERARKEYGDLETLKASIVEHGLLHPIVLLPDNYLLCGGRRLEAYRQLGEQYIPFRRVSTQGDAISRLKAERDENTCRKEMTPSELVAIGKKLEELKRPEAAARQGIRNDLATSRPAGREVRHHDTREEIADALGLSTSQYSRMRRVVEAASDETLDDDTRLVALIAQEEMDSGKITVNAAAEKVKAARAKVPAPPPAPPANDRPRNVPREQRVEQIRELADTGRTSGQIGDDIGVGEEQVRRIAKEAGITITADELLRGTRRFKVDHNHVIDHLAMSLDALLSGLSIVNYDALDIRRIEQWVMSLTASRTQLNSCIAEIKKRSAL